MAKILYKPLGLVVSAVGAIVAGAIFKQIWRAVAHEDDAPKATDARRGWGEVVTASAAQGAVVGGVKAVIDRAGATGFARLTGAWPGPSEK
jgi:Protein of unknown function (DUF4235)